MPAMACANAGELIRFDDAALRWVRSHSADFGHTMLSAAEPCDGFL
jgi:hypothetical protein